MLWYTRINFISLTTLTSTTLAMNIRNAIYTDDSILYSFSRIQLLE